MTAVPGRPQCEGADCTDCATPSACPACLHPTVEHSREDGVGCLHRMPPRPPGELYPCCPCLEPGTSEADQ